jgi:hypothetical protein
VDNWEKKNNGITTQKINTFGVNSSGDIFVGTSDSGVFKSTDNGENWLQINNGLNSLAINSIVVTSENEIFVASNTVYLSTNSGNQWTSISDGLYSPPLSLAVDSNNKVFAGTVDAGVFYLAEGPTSIDNSDTLTLSNFVMLQNYPNPFNSSCTIKYSIPKSSQILLKIFNTLGQEIETLVNEEKPIGTYELNWNAANLPSGVYFFRLQASGYVETKKMILLK